MKYIKFCDEVMRVPDSVTFWIMCRGDAYGAPYCVNMSPLEEHDFNGEPNVNAIIRSEGYKTHKQAKNRLDQILEILNT